MTSGGFTAAHDELIPEYERATQNTVVTAYGASMGGAPDSIPMRLARGEPADVVILATTALDELIQQGHCVLGWRGSRSEEPGWGQGAHPIPGVTCCRSCHQEGWPGARYIPLKRRWTLLEANSLTRLLYRLATAPTLPLSPPPVNRAAMVAVQRRPATSSIVPETALAVFPSSVR